MKLIFASDIYGSLPATERVLELFAQSGAQWLVTLGDVLNRGPCNASPEGCAPAEVAERLNEMAHKVITMRDSCDSEMDQMLLHFPITTPWQQVLLEKQHLFLTHGHLFGPENLPTLDQNDMLVYGHTHLPVTEQRGGTFHFNPGSVSIPKDDNSASYGMLDNDVPSVIALNDQSVIAQVAINPQFAHNSKCTVRAPEKKGFLIMERRRLASTEWVDIVNEENEVIAQASREQVWAQRLRHRATYIIVHDGMGKILVQHRTETKDFLPGILGATAGGMVQADEQLLESTRCETEEELGIAGVLFVEHGQSYLEDRNCRVQGALFSCISHGPFALQEDEVSEVCWLTPEEVTTRCDELTPDSLKALALWMERSAKNEAVETETTE